MNRTSHNKPVPLATLLVSWGAGRLYYGSVYPVIAVHIVSLHCLGLLHPERLSKHAPRVMEAVQLVTVQALLKRVALGHELLLVRLHGIGCLRPYLGFN